MHQPRPFGLHVENGELTKDDLSFVQYQAQRLTNLKDLSGVDTLKMVYDLPDGGFVILQDAGGVFRAIVDKQAEAIVFDNANNLSIPMLFSGVITKVPSNGDDPTKIKITEQCRRRIANYDDTQKPAKELSLKRFTIGDTDPLTGRFVSRYKKVYPSMYSGAMAEVIQIIGGYGRQDIDAEYAKKHPIEVASMRLPVDVLQRIKEEIKSISHPMYSGGINPNGDILYSYQFNRTDVVVFSEDDTPWLVRISAKGVLAMVLPRILATMTNEFRRYIKEKGDEEILAILDRFGGMPSGESFPDSKYLDNWIRAGHIIKVCDSSDFYRHIAYASTLGWSINTTGSEGYNTCYDYEDDTGVCIGYSYKLKLIFKNVKNNPFIDLPNKEDREKVKKYLTWFISLLTINQTEKEKAVIAKLARVEQIEILDRALSAINYTDELDYWDKKELEPIAPHMGNITRVAKGYLYHNAKPKFQPQIKFPEPLLGGCVSFDFSPNIDGGFNGKKPNCDTIMFAYYVDDILQVVKYFVDWRNYVKEIESDYEQYMYVGSWTSITRIGNTGIQGYFYTSDIDDREEVSPTETTTTIVGEDKGYDTKPFFYFLAYGGMTGLMSRNRYFTHLTKTVTDSDKQISTAICVPLYARNAVIHAKKKTIPVRSESESLELHSVRDPYSYDFWTHHSVFAWHSMYISNPKGKPYPVDGNPVWVEVMNYNPSEANAWADNGDWVGGLPADYGWLVHPDANVWNYSGGGGAPNVKEYTKSTTTRDDISGELKISGFDVVNVVHKNIPDNGYFRVSPDEYGNLFSREVVKICFGSKRYLNIDERNLYGERVHFGYTALADHGSAHAFFGVINE